MCWVQWTSPLCKRGELNGPSPHRDSGVSVESSPPPDCVVLRAAVHVQVRPGRRHDGAVWGLESHVEEERRGGVVTFYPGDCSPDITLNVRLMWDKILFH